MQESLIMNPLYIALCLLALSSLPSGSSEKQTLKSQKENAKEEMHLITKSLEELLAELSLIKSEANGRLTSIKNRASSEPDHERIRRIKVSRFVLTRVAELEAESLSMRDELLAKLNQLNQQAAPLNSQSSLVRQEDHDFDEPATTTTTTTKRPGSSSEANNPSSTSKPTDDEAAKIGFDIEALKKLGEEIGKRLDQFGKDTAKNLGDLLEGVKLVFREPSAQVESEIEARQAQSSESLRGVHAQVIKLVDNMVQNYLGNVRRVIQRMNNFIDNRRSSLGVSTSTSNQQPRESPTSELAQLDASTLNNFYNARNSILNRIELVSRKMQEFPSIWTNTLQGKQQSPLIDRIPPRGVELWRDFWDTVRNQMRSINQEFRQISRDMARLVTGSIPTVASSHSLLYSANSEQVLQHLKEFQHELSVALSEGQQKLDSLNRIAQTDPADIDSKYNIIDDQDDQVTRDELNRNVALRMQIRQEISVFGSIFDIMSAFVQRLRESASNVVRDVIQPGANVINNNNDPVTPGPSIKPQVDSLLNETVNSQRNINSQAKPVLLPIDRPSMDS